MSVLLSIILLCLFSSSYVRNDAFQIGGFRDIEENWMVLCLPTNLDQAKSSASIQGGVGEHFEEVGRTHVVGTGAAHQDTAGAEHLQGAEVEFFVAPESRVEIALAFGEGGGGRERWCRSGGWQKSNP